MPLDANEPSGYCTVKNPCGRRALRNRQIFAHTRAHSHLDVSRIAPKHPARGVRCDGIAKRGIRLRCRGSSGMIPLCVQRYVRAVRRGIRRRGCFMDCVAGRPNGRRNGEIPPVSLHSVRATRAFRVLLCVIFAACLPICLPLQLPSTRRHRLTRQ